MNVSHIIDNVSYPVKEYLKSFQYPANMMRLKKHIPICPDNDRRGNKDDNRFNAFCLGRHCYLLLHKINEKMEYDACQDRTVARKINPGDDKSHGDGTYKKVDRKQRIDHKSRLIGSFDEKKRKMPERPYRPEDDRLQEPIHIVTD